MRAHDFADGRGIFSRYYIDDACRKPGALRKLCQSKRCEWRFRRGFHDTCATNCQSWGDLARDHRCGKIPWRNGSDNTNGLTRDNNARICAMGGDCIAINALAFFGVEFDEGCGIIDLAQCFAERLALFAGENEREILPMGDDEIEPFAHEIGALFGEFLGPRLEGLLCRLNRTGRFSRAEIGHMSQQFTGCGVANGARALPDPLAVDIGLLAQQ